MFWNRSQKCNKGQFDHLLSVARKLPICALPDLIRAISRPIQSDFLLAVAEEGTDARPDMTPSEFFFNGLSKILDYQKLKQCEKNPRDYLLFLATDVVLPWPWSLSRYITCISDIGTHKGTPWKQDYLNHYVDLWLPWKIGFVRGGNHSITAGILAGEGIVVPKYVYDMSYLFDIVCTDGVYWFINGAKVEKVSSARSAAVFEIGRLISTSTQ